MTIRILHLSDTHVGADGFDEDGVDALGSLEQMLLDCRQLPRLDLVLVTGDIADDGSEQGCAHVRDRIGAFATERGIPQLYTTGNHDRRGGFVGALGTGHLSRDGCDIGRPLGPSGAIAAVTDVRGLRVITLDSLIEGSGHGRIGAEQLDALASELNRPAASGTVLSFHHPPIGAGSAPWTSDIGLRNPQDLAAVVAGSDVRAILCGHLHMQLVGPFADTTVWVTPGVLSRFDLTAPADRVRVVQGASASVVEFGSDRSPTCYLLHARDPAAGHEVVVADSTTWQPATEASSTSWTSKATPRLVDSRES